MRLLVSGCRCLVYGSSLFGLAFMLNMAQIMMYIPLCLVSRRHSMRFHSHITATLWRAMQMIFHYRMKPSITLTVSGDEIVPHASVYIIYNIIIINRLLS